jgi:hypothetical protein
VVVEIRHLTRDDGASAGDSPDLLRYDPVRCSRRIDRFFDAVTACHGIQAPWDAHPRLTGGSEPNVNTLRRRLGE